jgi:hypothetical protein
LRKRKAVRSVRVWSVLGKASVLILLAAAAFDGVGRADARDPVSAAPVEETPPPTEQLDFHVPNTLYTDSPGAILLEDLTPAEQEAVLDIGERTDYGASVHSAWSAATHSISADARVQRAAHASGTAGLDTIGVEP